MTVIRSGLGELFIHSPTPLVPRLRSEIDTFGTPRWIVGPNRIHYWWIPEWHAAFDDAQVYLAPRIQEQAGRHVELACHALDRQHGYPWGADIATLSVAGSYMTEVVFFHRASRTLVLTDLIENFEPKKIDSLVMRWLTRLSGVQDPDGAMPRDMRLAFRSQKPQLKAAVETMIGWTPERIILAHGPWYDRNGTDALRRAFRWLLD
jgi:hypothetical protein